MIEFIGSDEHYNTALADLEVAITGYAPSELDIAGLRSHFGFQVFDAADIEELLAVNDSVVGLCETCGTYQRDFDAYIDVEKGNDCCFMCG